MEDDVYKIMGYPTNGFIYSGHAPADADAVPASRDDVAAANLAMIATSAVVPVKPVADR